MSKELPNFEYVASLLEYDPDSGDLRWKKARSSRVKVGQVVRYEDRDGYLRVGINGRPYKAHRVAWLLTYGHWPDGVIDHINGIRTDNRLSNLRVATTAQNVSNAKMNKRNTSGVKGVSWKDGAWCATIGFAGKNVYLGRHATIECAEAAVRKAREELHAEFANHGDMASEQAAATV